VIHIGFLGVSGALPPAGGGNTSFIVATGTPGSSSAATVLVDCSGTPMAGLSSLGVPAETLHALILTHNHIDHVYGLPSLIHGMLMVKRTRPFIIAGLDEVLQRGRRVLEVHGLQARAESFGLVWHELDRRPLQLPSPAFDEGDAAAEPLTITSFPADHNIPVLGLVFSSETTNGWERICYSCDTRPCREVREATFGCDVLIHECSGTLDEERELNAAGHSSARQAGETGKDAGVSALYLVHLPGTRDTYSRYVEEARTAAPNLPAIVIPDRLYWYTASGSVL